MKVEKQDLRLGLFVLGGFGILVGLTVFKTAPQVTDRTTPLTVGLSDMGGLQVGTPVTLQGFRVGKVERLDLRREGVEYRVEATLALREDLRLWRGTRAEVLSQGFGSASLALVLPDPQDRQTPLPKGARIEGGLGPSLDQAIAKADRLLGALNASVEDLRLQFQRRGAGLLLDHPSVARALKDLDATLQEHQALAAEGRGLVTKTGRSLDASLRDLEQSLALVKELLQKRSGDLDQTLGGLATLTQRLNVLTQTLQEAASADQPQVAASLQQLRQTLGSLNELVNLLKQKPRLAVWGTPTEAERKKAKEDLK